MFNNDTYFDEPDFKSHMYFIIKESSLIVETDPFESLKLFNTVYKMYDEVGHFPHEIIELSVNIVFNIAKRDMDEAIKQLKIIEVEHYELDALRDILIYAKNPIHLEFINNRIQELEKVIEEYEYND